MTPDKSQLYDELLSLYAVACKAGVCTNQQNFAHWLGVTTSTISGAFKQNPQNLTASLINKIRKRLINDGLLQAQPVLVGDTSIMQNQSPSAQVGISEEKHAQIISGILSEMAAQRETYERIIMAALSGKTDK